MITELKPNEIFVFGSNLAGRHGRGAALQAFKEFGAVYGVGEGLTGRCYALPTLTKTLRKRSTGGLLASIALFNLCTFSHPEFIFLLTKVGCGLAGYSEHYIKSLFNALDASDDIWPSNVIMPEGWRIDHSK